MSILVPVVSWPLVLVTDFPAAWRRLVLNMLHGEFTLLICCWILCVFSFIGCFVVLLLSVFRFTSFLALFTLHYNVCYASDSPLLLYIPPSALFAVVPLCPIVQQYETFSIKSFMTSTRVRLERNDFCVFSKFEGHKLTFLPLFSTWENKLKLTWKFEVVFCSILINS
jgi:hypothetical protein